MIWHREGIYYVCRFNVYKGVPNRLVYLGYGHKKLSFVSYHLIKLFLGEKKLREIASKNFLDFI